MKVLPYRSFEVGTPDGKETTISTGNLLLILAAAHDGQGLKTDDVILLGDVRRAIKDRDESKAETVKLENAEHSALVNKLAMVRWPLDGDEVVSFIKDIRAAQDAA